MTLVPTTDALARFRHLDPVRDRVECYESTGGPCGISRARGGVERAAGHRDVVKRLGFSNEQRDPRRQSSSRSARINRHGCRLRHEAERNDVQQKKSGAGEIMKP